MYCGKTADWIWMPVWVVSWVIQGTYILDGVVIIEWEGAILGVNVWHPIVTNRMVICSSLTTLGRTCFIYHMLLQKQIGEKQF